MSNRTTTRLERTLWITSVLLALTAGKATATEASLVDLAGTWKLIPELSDDARQALEEQIESRKSEARSGRRLAARRRAKKAKKKIEGARQALEGYDQLEISFDGATMTLTNAKDVEHTIFTDGREIRATRGTRQSAGLWQGGRLVVTRQSQRGHLEEVFTLEDTRLIIETTLFGDRTNGLTLRRFYERQTE